MELCDVLRLAAFSGLTAAQASAKGLESVELSRDSTSYTWSGVNEKLVEAGVDLQIVAAWNTVLDSISGGSMLGEMLRSGGCDFTRPTLRGQLAAVLATDPGEPVATVLQALLDIGIQYGTRWAYHSVAPEPTVEQIQAAMDLNRRTDWLDYRVAAVRSQLASLGSVDAVRTALGAE